MGSSLTRVKALNDHINPPQLISIDELSKHSTENDCWVAIRDEVYDLTNFLKDHPGGKRPILVVAGKDATEDFLLFHQLSYLKKHLKPENRIGHLKK